VHGWGLGANIGPTPEIVDGMRSRLQALHERHGRRVSMVGWSLGGVFARELARETPDAVRQVITLGSPFRLRPGDASNGPSLGAHIEERYIAMAADALLPEEERPRLQVPVTAIYTRTDGVVRWYGCIECEGDRCENIEVRGTHSGLGHNPAVLVAVADRLAQPEGEWAPFHPPFGTAHLFPRPTSYRRRDAEQEPSHAA
jgi:pimeloyl-ACP methyl ester carboxylesterase